MKKNLRVSLWECWTFWDNLLRSNFVQNGVDIGPKNHKSLKKITILDRRFVKMGVKSESIPDFWTSPQPYFWCLRDPPFHHVVSRDWCVSYSPPDQKREREREEATSWSHDPPQDGWIRALPPSTVHVGGAAAATKECSHVHMLLSPIL